MRWKICLACLVIVATACGRRVVDPVAPAHVVAEPPPAAVEPTEIAPAVVDPPDPEPVAIEPSADPAGTTEPDAEALASPEALRLDRAFWTETDRHPRGDAHATVARREHIDVQALMAAISEVSAYRVRVEAEAREMFGTRPAMQVLPDGIHGTARGNTTLAVRLFIPGCPRPRGANPEQVELAQEMLIRLVSMLPEGVDSLDADLWSDGAPCGRRQLSFAATWSREDNRVSIADR